MATGRTSGLWKPTAVVLGGCTFGDWPKQRRCTKASVCDYTTHNINCFTALCQGLPRWGGTRRNTHPPSWSLSSLLQLLPSMTIHSILPVQITCFTIFLHNLSPHPLLSASWSGALYLVFHTFLHPISVFFSQHMPIPSQPVLLYSIKIILFIPNLSLSFLLGLYLLP